MSKIVANNISPRSGDTVTVNGNISVGGTVTYQDVTNIDSVGMVTARKGIQVLADGINAVGVMTATTFSGSGANLTNIPSGQLTGALPAIDGSSLTGIQVGTRNFVGYGTNITAGKPVGLGSDGTVRAIAGESGTPPTIGSPTTFESGATVRLASVYDSTEQKTVIIYSDYGDSSKGKSVVGSISNETVTFGSATQFEAGDTRFTSIAYDPDTDRVIAHYIDNGNSDNPTWCVGEVGSSSVSWGTPSSYYGNSAQYTAAVYDTLNNKIILIWNNSQSGELRAVTGTVNGASTNTLNLGSTQEIGTNANTPDKIGAVFHSGTNQTVVVFENIDDSNKGYYSVATGSASDTQSWSTISAFTTSAIDFVDICYDSTNERLVVAYRDTGNSSYGTAIVGSLNANTITWGNAVVFNEGDTEEIRCEYDSVNGRVVIAYKDAGNSDYGSFVVGTVGGSNSREITFGSESNYSASTTSGQSLAFDTSSSRFLIGYSDGGISGDGKAVVVAAGDPGGDTNLTAENYIGLAAAGISSGATGTITIPGGIDSNQTGLTTGRTYYVQTDGTLGLSADIPSVVAGTSISATEILVR